MAHTRRTLDASQLTFLLGVRVGLGQDAEALLGNILNAHLDDREILSVTTARQGLAMEFTYQTRLKHNASPDTLVNELNRVEGVQNVNLRRRDFE